VLHAFDEPRAPLRRQPWSAGDFLLVILCLPPVLLALWAGSIHHNGQRGVAAVRYSTGFGDPAERPLFMVGSIAGLVLVGLITLTGGPAVAAEALGQRWIWVIILLPDLAWLAPLGLACVLLPLRRPMIRLMPSASRSAFGD
jgi:hypothetical protein